MSEQDEMKKMMAYLIGFRLGSQVLPQMLPGLESSDVVAEMLGRGVQDGIGGDMDMSLINEKVDQYQHDFIAMLQQRGDARSKANLELGRKYMAENGKKPGVTTTQSGLQYEVITPRQRRDLQQGKARRCPDSQGNVQGHTCGRHGV